jgi:probable selenium-dependent hydroxylase accessory protein YqeC
MTMAKGQTDPELLVSSGHRLIAFTGAGGKTSLIRWLASHFQLKSQRVIITTTTKIFPFPGEKVLLQDDGPDFMGRIRHAFGQSSCITLARKFDPVSGKLIGLDKETVTLLHKAGMADMILVEADGAARKPLKAPAEHEPVIPAGTDLCIAVMGLDAAYRPLIESRVHRHQKFSRITGLTVGGDVTPVHMTRIAMASQGLFKGCSPECELRVFLNKTDIPGGLALVDEFQYTLSTIEQPGNIGWFAGSIRNQYMIRMKSYTSTVWNDSDTQRVSL